MILKKCEKCNKDFYVRNYRKDTAHFCSKSCHLQKQIGTGGAIPCVFCGKLHYRAASHLNITKNPTCSLECRGSFQKTLISEPRSGKDFPNVKDWMKRRGMVKKCERCNFDKIPGILVVHHKDRDRLNNKLENLEVLCPNCHALEHYVESKEGWLHKSNHRRHKVAFNKVG